MTNRETITVSEAKRIANERGYSTLVDAAAPEGSWALYIYEAGEGPLEHVCDFPAGGGVPMRFLADSLNL